VTRFRLLVEYDGGPFVGWQRQDNGPSVQQAIEDAIFAFCQERVASVAAGRTDAGVHALGQVVHVDLMRDCTADTLRDAVNFHLKPRPIAILSAAPVTPDFHARFSATGRRYLYRIVNRRGPLALQRGRAWWLPGTLDADGMATAAQRLIGRHDFASFRSSICQAASPVKTLDLLSVERSGEEIRIEAAARSFLHHQVRNMVGSLKLVGEGRWTADDLSNALEARDRRAAGPTAPPEGLYLIAVTYQ
jgi:tRNA pseudouridine38-40 synthase